MTTTTQVSEKAAPVVLPVDLRDYFAAHALAAMTASPDYSKGPCNTEMADRAFIIADAMLSARAKGEK